MSSANFEDIPKRAENVQWREFGTDGILLDSTSGDYFEINEVGLMIWTLVDGQKTIAEILEALARYFDAEVEELVEETREFLTELITKGLITVA